MTATDRVRLVAPGAAVEVDTRWGGRVASWVVGDVELLCRHGEAPQLWGMYPMAPWPGRLRGNRVERDGRTVEFSPTFQGWAIHGTVLDRPATVVALTQEPAGCRLELVSPLGERWPWAGVVRQVLELRAGWLRTTIAVESDEVTFPAEVGWHPWFRRDLADRDGNRVGGTAQVDLPATGLLERGSDYLPSGVVRDPADVPGPYDDAFVVPSGRAAIAWPGALRLDISADVGWYVLFDMLPDAVCLEPQSGPPDGLGPEAALAVPGTPRSATADWRWVVDATPAT
jgi:aldose 1-epimerase